MNGIRKAAARYKELILYGIFGAAATLINMIGFSICRKAAGMGLVSSNVLSWAAAFLFAFITNKLWVFDSKGWKSRTAVREMAGFLAVRLVTLVLDTCLMQLFIERMQVCDLSAKMVVNVIVIVLNYAAGKFLVFRKKDERNSGR